MASSASDPSTGLNGWGPFFDPLQTGFTGACLQQCTNYDNTFNPFGTNLLASFSAPVDQVNVYQTGNAFNGADLMAFNAANQMVGICEVNTGATQAPGNYGCYSIFSPESATQSWQVETSIQAPSITKILIGGDNSSGDQIQTIRYGVVAPEIDTVSAASGVMLLLGGLAVLRGRRARL